MLDNSMCQNFTPSSAFPIPSPASCWSGTEGSVVITKRYLESRSTTHPTEASEGHPTEAPRDGLEGMEFVPPQRLNQKNNLGLRNN